MKNNSLRPKPVGKLKKSKRQDDAVFASDPLKALNLIGPAVRRLRRERHWTQEMFAAIVEGLGAAITRDIIANIETQRSIASDKQIAYFAIALSVPIKKLFPIALKISTR